MLFQAFDRYRIIGNFDRRNRIDRRIIFSFNFPRVSSLDGEVVFRQDWIGVSWKNDWDKKEES